MVCVSHSFNLNQSVTLVSVVKTSFFFVFVFRYGEDADAALMPFEKICVFRTRKEDFPDCF